MPKFYPIDEQMKELSAMLEKEISDWPGVSKRPMFAYQGLYRDGQILAALPRSRAMKSPTSIMVKFASASAAVLESIKKDSRVDPVSGMSGAGWFFFELDDASAQRAPSAGSAALTKPPESSRYLAARSDFHFFSGVEPPGCRAVVNE